MAFIETQFPSDIVVGVTGGPGFETEVVPLNSGFEQRNATWEDSRCEYDAAHGVKTQAQLNTLIAFFRVMKGRANGFRFKDWTDYTDGGGGIFVQLTSTTWQMYKRYTTAGNNHDRKITKPVNGTLAITPGSFSVDYTTGIVTAVGSPTVAPTSWTGEFDVPCRFDIDRMKARIEDYGIYSWESIPIVEIRV